MGNTCCCKNNEDGNVSNMQEQKSKDEQLRLALNKCKPHEK